MSLSFQTDIYLGVVPWNRRRWHIPRLLSPSNPRMVFCSHFPLFTTSVIFQFETFAVINYYRLFKCLLRVNWVVDGDVLGIAIDRDVFCLVDRLYNRFSNLSLATAHYVINKTGTFWNLLFHKIYLSNCRFGHLNNHLSTGLWKYWTFENQWIRL